MFLIIFQLNLTTTSNLIQSTSEMLRDNSVKIQEQAASATIGLSQLQAAFANIYHTMDAIDTYKVQALDAMAQRVPVPGLAPAYPVRLPELPYGMTLTSVEVGPGVVRVGATLPEWRLDLPRAVLDEVINQLSVVGRPLDVIWPG